MWDGYSVKRFIIEIDNKPPYENLRDLILEITPEDIAAADIIHEDGDVKYYGGYELNEKQLVALKSYATSDFLYDFEKYKYVLFCEQA